MSKKQIRLLVLLGMVLALTLFAAYLVVPSLLRIDFSAPSMTSEDRRATAQANIAIIEACSEQTTDREEFNICLTINGVATPAP